MDRRPGSEDKAADDANQARPGDQPNNRPGDAHDRPGQPGAMDQKESRQDETSAKSAQTKNTQDAKSKAGEKERNGENSRGAQNGNPGKEKATERSPGEDEPQNREMSDAKDAKDNKDSKARATPRKPPAIPGGPSGSAPGPRPASPRPATATANRLLPSRSHRNPAKPGMKTRGNSPTATPPIAPITRIPPEPIKIAQRARINRRARLASAIPMIAARCHGRP